MTLQEEVAGAVHRVKVTRGWIIATTVVCIVVSIFAVFSTIFAIRFYDDSAPTIIQMAIDADTITYKDGNIQMYYKIMHIRRCTPSSSRYLWTYVNYQGRKLPLRIPMQNATASDPKIGTDEFLLSMPMPPGVFDGQWYFRSITSFTCGISDFFHTERQTDTGNIPIWIKGVTPDHKPSQTSTRPSRVTLHRNGYPDTFKQGGNFGNPLP